MASFVRRSAARQLPISATVSVLSREAGGMTHSQMSSRCALHSTSKSSGKYTICRMPASQRCGGAYRYGSLRISSMPVLPSEIAAGRPMRKFAVKARCSLSVPQ